MHVISPSIDQFVAVEKRTLLATNVGQLYFFLFIFKV